MTMTALPMRTLSNVTLHFLLVFAAVVALPSRAAQWVPSAEAPFVAKFVQAETFRLEPGAKSAMRIELGEVDAGEIAAVKQANSDQFTKRLQIGIGRSLPAATPRPQQLAHWEPVAGGVAAQWKSLRAGAMALRIGLDIDRLPSHGADPLCRQRRHRQGVRTVRFR